MDPGPPSAPPPASDRAIRDRQLFNEIAESYCRKDLHRGSRRARRHRLERTLAAVPLKPAPRILEIGCGAGYSAAYLEGRYAELVGIDYADELIRYAQANNARPGASFECVGADDFRPERRFDAVVMIGVLHHLEDVRGTLERVVSLLEPGGWLLANEPQPANPFIHLARAIRKRVDPKYSADQVELSARELTEALASAGLEQIRLVPQGLLSTPFAEVALRPEALVAPAAALACALDTLLERLPDALVRRLSWNLIAAGRRPA